MATLRSLSNDELESRFLKLGRLGNSVLVAQVLCLAEIHRRRIHLAAGFDSLAHYSREVLREDRRKAWRLSIAAEAAARFPAVCQLLTSKRLTVSALIALKRVLTEDNHLDILHTASGMTEDDAERLAAQLAPREKRPDTFIPVFSDDPAQPGRLIERCELRATLDKDVLAQLDAVKNALSHVVPDGNLNDVLAHCFRFTLEACARRKIGANVPFVVSTGIAALPTNADESVGDDAALTSASSTRDFAAPPRLSQTRVAAPSCSVPNPPSLGDSTSVAAPSCSAPTPRLGDSTSVVAGSAESSPPSLSVAALSCSAPNPPGLSTSGLDFSTSFLRSLGDARRRYIPVAVRRAVWIRDGGCCSYVAANGRRCCSRFQLEFDHWRAFCLGGEHTVENVRVLCARHNRFEAERVLGRALMQKYFDRVIELFAPTGLEASSDEEIQES